MEQTLSNEKTKNIALLWMVYGLYFVYAASMTMLGPLIPIYMSKYGISLSESGLITFFRGIGSVAASLLGVLLSDRMKKSSLINISSLAFILSVILIIVSPSYEVFLVLFFFIGISTRLFDLIANAYISDVYPNDRSRYISILHVVFGFGAVLGPILSTIFVGQAAAIFLILGIMYGLVFAAYLFLYKKADETGARAQAASFKEILAVMRKKNMLILCSFSFLFMGFIISITNWLPTYMTDTLRTSVFLSSLPVSVLWAGVTLGRMRFTAMLKRLDIKKYLITNNALCTVFLIAATIINDPIVYIAAYALAGYLIGSIPPLNILTGCNWYPEYSGSVSSAHSLFTSLSFMLSPWLIGLVSDVNFKAGLLVMNLIPAAMIIFALFLPSKKKVC